MLTHYDKILWIILFFWFSTANAITIDINGGREAALPIAIVPFGYEGPGPAPSNIAAIISGDLGRTGRFEPLSENNFITQIQPHSSAEVHYEDWRLFGSDNLVVGMIQSSRQGVYDIQFELLDVPKGAGLVALAFPGTTQKNLRRVAHEIANIIYERLTGEKGIFNTTLAYVAVSSIRGSPTYTLRIADIDGYNEKTILTSKEPIISPKWAPDNSRIAYVSFENRHPVIYIQNMASSKREPIVGSPETHSSAPAWSPDGRYLAMSLSKDGNPEIYTFNLSNHSLRQITNNTAIDTEPTWSPDGSTLVFTSDRSGSPQLYQVPASGGLEKRLTFEGNYNASPQFSPDGRKLVFIHGNGKINHVAIFDLTTGETHDITNTYLDESPCFSPNGNLVIYASEEAGRDVLRITSVDGHIPQHLDLKQESNFREPAWSSLVIQSQTDQTNIRGY